MWGCLIQICTGKLYLFSLLQQDSKSNFGKYNIVLSVTWVWWNWSDCYVALTLVSWSGWCEPFGGYSISLLGFTHFCGSLPPPQLCTHARAHTHNLHSYQWIQMNLGGTHLNPALGLSHTRTLVYAPPSQGLFGVSKVTG